MIYLDNAATSFPKPPEVIRAVSGVMKKIGGNPGRAGHEASLAGGRIISHCRELAAELLGCSSPERIIFCLNCTDALNIALRGTLQWGDEVLVSHAEHNAVMRVLKGYEAQGALSVRVLQPDANGIIAPQSVHEAVTPHTALCVISHASNVTGIIQPVRSIAQVCHAHGVPLLLDAAQTAGTEDLRLVGADMIAMPGHKGLLGPMGTGILYVGPGMLPRPFREGGTGSASESMLQPSLLPDRLESGTANLPGIAGLVQGIKFVLRHQSAIAQYEQALAGRLRAGLKGIPGITIYGADSAPRVGLVSFNVGQMESSEVADALNTRRIAVRGGLHCAPSIHQYLGPSSGAVRVSVGPFNTEAEIDQALEAIQTIARNSR